MTHVTAPTSAPTIVPLARDEHGRQVAVPSEAAFWRVRRHTRGRPRNVTGVDRQPLRLPLDFTEGELDSVLGAGTYRLDLCDAAGEPLDVTVTVAVGEPEPTHVGRAVEDGAPSPMLPANASDVRLVLEANVRAAQMAFQHNERTLAVSLRMAETLRDGIRDLANAQASWITALAQQRGFFRNAAPALPAPAQEGGGQDEDADDERETPGWMQMMQPLVATITESAVAALAKRAPTTAGTRPRNGFEMRELVDWRYAATKAPQGAGDAADMQGALQTKAMAVLSLLDEDERKRLVRLVPALAKHAGEPEMQAIASELLPLSDEDAAAWVRAHLDEIEVRFAS